MAWLGGAIVLFLHVSALVCRLSPLLELPDLEHVRHRPTLKAVIKWPVGLVNLFM